MTAHNENCLAGLRCPKCKEYGPFNIECRATVTMHDDGSKGTTGHNWDTGASCWCVSCHYAGKVQDFTRLDDDEEQSLLNALVTQCLHDERFLRALLLERVVRSEGRPFAEDFWDNFDPADFGSDSKS